MVSALILQLIQSCTAGTNRYGSKELDDQHKDEILGIDIHGDINNLKKVSLIKIFILFYFLIIEFVLIIFKFSVAVLGKLE